MFFEGIRSERQLIETASLNLAHRWYLGYALDEDLPDHSSLTRIRQRLGIDIFQRFFEQVVDLCQEAGLVWGRELYFDATKVEANADLDSLVPRFYHEAKTHVADLFADDAAPADGGATGMPQPTTCRPASCGCRARAADERRRSQRSAAGGCWRSGGWTRTGRRVGSYRRTSDFRVSPTDPDATPMRTGAGRAWATTTTTSSMAASAASSSPPSSRRPT